MVDGKDAYALQEPGMPYTAHFAPKMEALSAENGVFLW
jgi:hypothetical protein